MTLSCTRCGAKDPAGTFGSPCPRKGCRGVLKPRAITNAEVAAYRAATAETNKRKE